MVVKVNFYTTFDIAYVKVFSWDFKRGLILFFLKNKFSEIFIFKVRNLELTHNLTTN